MGGYNVVNRVFLTPIVANRTRTLRQPTRNRLQIGPRSEWHPPVWRLAKTCRGNYSMLLFLLFLLQRRIPRVPALPLIGHILALRDNPSRVLMRWARRYGPTFYIRLGATPVLVANSHRDVATLWVQSASANNLRPLLHTFQSVSDTCGLTVGSTPAGPSCTRQKKALGRHVQPSRVRAAFHVIDCVSRVTLGALESGNVLRHLQYYKLAILLWLTYGIRLECYGRDRALADIVIATEAQIIKLRLPIAHAQDHLSFLRWLLPDAAKATRDAYMALFFADLERRLLDNEPCAAQSLLGQLLSERETKNTPSRNELQLICLTMVSAGLDNVLYSFYHLVGQLAHHEAAQDKLLLELTRHRTVDEAWRRVVEMDCVYAHALIHEALRFFTVLPMGLPRRLTKAIKFRGETVPAGTLLFMNAYAANHDELVFEKPFDFVPERWIENGKLKRVNHYTFGAGLRMCLGNHLAVREMYTLLCRFTLLYRVFPGFRKMEQDPFKGNACPSGTLFEPKPFDVELRRRFGEAETQRLLRLNE